MGQIINRATNSILTSGNSQTGSGKTRNDSDVFGCLRQGRPGRVSCPILAAESHHENCRTVLTAASTNKSSEPAKLFRLYQVN